MAKRWARLVAALAVAITIIGGSVGLAGAGASDPARAPGTFPGDTIVEVTGDSANGLEIYRLDGSSLYPLTDSEARAECSEHDIRVARARCRTEGRTWYRDLADLQLALAYARSR